MDLQPVLEILEINLPRPRDRQEIMSQEQYYDYREFLLNFLQKEPTKAERKDQLLNESNPQIPLNAPLMRLRDFGLTDILQNN